MSSDCLRLSSNSTFESGGRWTASTRVVELFAEGPVLLKRLDLVDALRDLGVRHRQPSRRASATGGPLVDQLPQDLLVEAKLLHHPLVEAGAVGVAEGLQRAAGRRGGTS